MPNNLTDNLSNNSPILSNGLTNAEIKKALECLEKDTNCGDCAVKNKCIGDCVFRKALDLINRQEAENNELQLKIKSYNAENEKLKAKNSNLTSDLTSLQNDLTSAQAEIERLQEVNNSFTDIGKLYSEIKAEAYKECLEKVKSLANNYSGYAFYKKLDNLLNELVGDAK